MPVRIACNTELQSSNKCVSSSVLWNLLLQTPFWIAEARPWPISPVQFLTNGSPSYMRVPYLGNRIEFCETELNFVTQNWILWHRIEFCGTELNFVTQNWVLWHKSEFCWQNQYIFNFVRQNSVLSHKTHFCQVYRYKNEFCWQNWAMSHLAPRTACILYNEIRYVHITNLGYNKPIV